MRANKLLQIEFNVTSLENFWCFQQHSYQSLEKQAINTLIPFAATYLSEGAFSALVTKKAKNFRRNSDEKTAKIRNTKWTSLKMDVTANEVTDTEDICTWMLEHMDKIAYGRYRKRMLHHLYITADKRDRCRTLQHMDFTADGRDRYRTSQHMDFRADGRDRYRTLQHMDFTADGRDRYRTVQLIDTTADGRDSY